MSGCENCNISVNNGKYRIGFHPCDYFQIVLLDTNSNLAFVFSASI